MFVQVFLRVLVGGASNLGVCIQLVALYMLFIDVLFSSLKQDRKC
jgi:hypothetical protein